MMRLRPFLTLALVFVMMATSVTMAVARGQMLSGDRVVICSGYGVATIELDENGNPTGPVFICPDCALSFLAFVDSAPGGLIRPETSARDLQGVAVVLPASRSLAVARARGPPLSV